MKSEERHRLQENEIQHFGKQAKDWLEKYGLTLAVGVAAVLVVVGVVVFWTRSARQTQANRWTPLVTAREAERFGEVADEYPGTTVGQWSRLKEAQQYLAEGTNLTLTDREASVTDLVKARQGFEAVLKSEPLTDPLRERALFGLARSLEVLAGVKVGQDEQGVEGVQPAIEAYQRLVQEFPNSVYVEVAQERIAALKQPDVQEFYAWFRQQNPGPLDTRGPRDQTGTGATGGTTSGTTPETDEGELADFNKFLREQGVDVEKPPAAAEKPAEAEKPEREGPTLTPPAE